MEEEEEEEEGKQPQNSQVSSQLQVPPQANTPANGESFSLSLSR